MRMRFLGLVLSCSLHRFASFYLSFSRGWYLESFCLWNPPRFSWYLQNVQRERRSPNCTSNCVRFVHFDNDAIMMGSANIMRKKRLFDMHLSIKLSNSIMSFNVVRATLVCANRSDRIGSVNLFRAQIALQHSYRAAWSTKRTESTEREINRLQCENSMKSMHPGRAQQHAEKSIKHDDEI